MEPVVLCPRCRKRNPAGTARCQFCGAAMAAPWGAGAAVPAAAPPPDTANERTSGLAIASLVLGLLGLFSFGLGALVGLVLGIVGLRQIGQSEGRVQGQGLAIAGIVVSGLVLVMMFVFLPITAAILFPVFAQAREKARASVCMSHVKQLGAAMMLYSEDYEGRWPRKENWCDGVLPYARSPQGVPAATVFQCPSLPNQSGAYAYNGLLSSVSGNGIAFPSNTAAVFDARGGWNLAGGAAMADRRHGNGLYMLFTDGHVRWLGAMDGVVWKPGNTATGSSQRRIRRLRRRG
jgi:prepilin-type processing-associated H-X9-DG protein